MIKYSAKVDIGLQLELANLTVFAVLCCIYLIFKLN